MKHGSLFSVTSFVSTERQARSYILSDLPPIGVDGFSQQLNKLHQSSQQLVGEGRHTPKLSPTTQPPTHHVSRETIAITKSRRES